MGNEDEFHYVWKENIIIQQKEEHLTENAYPELTDHDKIDSLVPCQWIRDMISIHKLYQINKEDFKSNGLNKNYAIVTGVLQISSKIQWGINSKGMRKYSFKPLFNTGEDYPM